MRGKMQKLHLKALSPFLSLTVIHITPFETMVFQKVHNENEVLLIGGV